MTFYQEPTGYEKTLLSDLQGAWLCLREAVVEGRLFDWRANVLFHIDEAMSWESVRDLSRMKQALLLVRNLIRQSSVDDEVHCWVEQVDRLFAELAGVPN